MDRIVGKIHEESTLGEKKLHRYFNLLLQEHRDSRDIRCYYDQVLRTEQRPDFTLITKKYGVLVIELKDYSDESLLYAYPDDQWVIKNIGMVPNPYQQLYNYKNQCISSRHIYFTLPYSIDVHG